MNWPSNVIPADLTDFETQARKLRYQALGRACKGQGIRHLLTAHHRDDQIETVLLGLVDGNARRYIRPSTPIPECWGIHGVHESGFHDVTLEQSATDTETKHDQCPEHYLPTVTQPPTFQRRLMEYGQVHLSRPLLGDDKQALTEICETGGINWEEDKSNTDLSKTPRNVVRFLLKNGNLPIALSKPSLLDLLERQQNRDQAVDRAAQATARSCQVISFDIRSGLLRVRLPYRLSLASPNDNIRFRRRVGVLVVESLLQAITPAEYISPKSLQWVAESIFPELRGSSSPSSGSKDLTAGGVHLRQIPQALQEQQVRSEQADIRLTPLDHDHVWVLSRQPYTNDSLSQVFPSSLSESLVDGTSQGQFRRSTTTVAVQTLWSEWKLWDGRYWIRVKNLTTQAVKVRHLSPSDVLSLKSLLDAGRWQQLVLILRDAAPGKVRRTLPIVVQQAADDKDDEKIIAIPSLGDIGDMRHLLPSNTDDLCWELRYKQVSTIYTKRPGQALPVSVEPHLIKTWDGELKVRSLNLDVECRSV